LSFRVIDKKAQPAARANGAACHASCRATSRAKQRRGSSVTFGKESSEMRRVLVAFAILTVTAVGLGAFWFLSPSRDLEVALGVKRLPASVHNVDMKVDAWTDYSVRAYFEIDPKDFERLLGVRSYEQVRTEILGIKVASIKGLASFARAARDMNVDFEYQWKGAKSTSCNLFTDASKRRVVVIYGTD
jgi:hypothetical protein